MLGDIMNIINLEEVDSTNLYAKQNFALFDDKTAIIANRQTAGRGRFDRKWIDLGGENLFMSIVLKPSTIFDCKYSNLTQYMCVVLAKTLEDYGLKPTIKWPNDVMVNNKKIAGILSETVIQGQNFYGLVLGIGVNINAEKDDLKQIKERVATALNIELKRAYEDKNLFAKKLLNNFFENYREFLDGGFPYIKDEYVKRCKILGKNISVQIFNTRRSGVAKYISDTGELIISEKGKEAVLTMGDIL